MKNQYSISMQDLYERERKNISIFSSKFENWFKDDPMNEDNNLEKQKKREAKEKLKKKV